MSGVRRNGGNNRIVLVWTLTSIWRCTSCRRWWLCVRCGSCRNSANKWLLLDPCRVCTIGYKLCLITNDTYPKLGCAGDVFARENGLGEDVPPLDAELRAVGALVPKFLFFGTLLGAVGGVLVTVGDEVPDDPFACDCHWAKTFLFVDTLHTVLKAQQVY